jgi:hypothetical protein
MFNRALLPRTATKYESPTALTFCPTTGEPTTLNNRTIVSTTRYEAAALAAAKYEDSPQVHFYDGFYYVTTGTNPKGYVCNSVRCYC